MADRKKREGAGVKKAERLKNDGYYSRALVCPIYAIDDETYYMARRVTDAFREVMRRLFSEVYMGYIATSDIRCLDIPDEARKAAEEMAARKKAAKKAAEEEAAARKKAKKGEGEKEAVEKEQVKTKRVPWGEGRALAVPNYSMLREIICRIFDIHRGTALVAPGESEGRKYYEFKFRFFQLWDAMRKADPKLPELGGWIWDGMGQRLAALLDGVDPKLQISDLWLFMRGDKGSKGFANFGLGFIRDENSRIELVTEKKEKTAPPANETRAERYLRESEEKAGIRISFRLNSQLWLTFVAAGHFTRKGKLQGRVLTGDPRVLLQAACRSRAGESDESEKYAHFGISPVLLLQDNKFKLELPYKKKYTSPKDLIDEAWTCVSLRPGIEVRKSRDNSGLPKEERKPFIVEVSYNRDDTTMITQGYKRHRRDFISCEHVLSVLKKYGAQQYKLDRELSSAYGMKDMQGVRLLRDRQHKLAQSRSGFAKSVNGHVACTALGLAKKWRTGRFVIEVPKSQLEEVDEETRKKAEEEGWTPEPQPKKLLLHSLSWPWYQLVQGLKYRAESAGFKVEIRENEEEAFVSQIVEVQERTEEEAKDVEEEENSGGKAVASRATACVPVG